MEKPKHTIGVQITINGQFIKQLNAGDSHQD